MTVKDHRCLSGVPDRERAERVNVPPGSGSLALIGQPTHYITRPLLRPLHFFPVITPANQRPTSLRKRHVFTRETSDILRKWLEDHLENPYPTDEDKVQLALKTKLSRRQICYWFINARRRLVPQYKSLPKPPSAERSHSDSKSHLLSPPGDSSLGCSSKQTNLSPNHIMSHVHQEESLPAAQPCTPVASTVAQPCAPSQLFSCDQRATQTRVDSTPIQPLAQTPTAQFGWPTANKAEPVQALPTPSPMEYHHAQIGQRRSSFERQYVSPGFVPLQPAVCPPSQMHPGSFIEHGSPSTVPRPQLLTAPQSQVAQQSFITSPGLSPTVNPLSPYSKQIAPAQGPLTWNTMSAIPVSCPAVEMASYVHQVPSNKIIGVPASPAVLPCFPQAAQSYQPVLAVQTPPATLFHQSH